MASTETTRVNRASSLRKILALARPQWRRLALGTFFLFLGSATGLIFPQAIRVIVDESVTGKNPSLLNQAALAMAGVFVIQGVAIALRYYLFQTAGERAVTRLRDQLYRSILSQEIAFFDQRRTGELTSRLSSDTTLLQSAVSANISMGLRNLVQGIGGITLLVATSPRLTLLMLSVVPAVALGAVAYGRKVRKLSREVQDALATSTEVAEESISGIRTVRSFDAEETEMRRYSGAVELSYQLGRKRAMAGASFMGGASFAAYAAATLVLWYGGKLAMNGEMSVGQLVQFLIYSLIVAFSLGAVSDLWAELMKASGAAERVFELIERKPVIATRGGLVPERIEGRVELSGVRFSYPSRPELRVLDGLSLNLSSGEVVALVGPSGAGKSTIAAMLARMYDPDEGTIRLDGRDLREVDPGWLRRHVGAVSQEPILFSSSIEENIRYGRPDATLAEVEAAARAANAHEFIARFPEGYRTAVGERGVQLSGGQKQRVAIARAMLKDPKILILDEATSALDAESEHLVQEALERLMKGRTTLIIAHRLSTVIGADRVLVLDRGQVVQAGSHETLVRQDGLYRKLVERQFVAA
ncbi:MAG: ABC transporter transmembrane domain-containing protein [Myxococcota bacterium]|nr:ABC transporter transmembrane domain-containing protein [Myxococcota bacterium]